MSLELSIKQLTLSIDILISILEKSNQDSNSDLCPVDLSPKSKPKTKGADAEDTTQAPAQPTPIAEIKDVAVQLVTEVATEQSYEDIREAIKGRCKTLMEKNRDNKAKIMAEFNKFNATHVSKVADKNLQPLLTALMEIK